ncbi:enoyl-CoA hydratase/isomerase family protein [Noviherbaspirillum saxi]|uniref:Enoyl-CoA hydratase/isomerase family protein n=1 Tax=Noviherbaspirillum saxi TaxID=2320863 RepID=A0A3A3G756_9BURK|nr:enoyl-CoA hydratase-related protein [Noviherbaspirillum saxi]RJF97975.1 enoyl-CoA hydratase/isomerase family protein [Noviherbaspirillum saxi]
MGEIRVHRQDLIATVTLSNPEKLNALSLSMWLALQQVFTELSADESLRCIIVQGENHQFAAGADVEEFRQVRNSVQQGIYYHEEAIAKALDAIVSCIHPTIAAIEGVCVGGGLEIASACDLRIAAPDARFGIPINRLGFSLAPREMQHFLALVGKATALEILLEGRVFGATEAKEKGLLTRIADEPALAAHEAAQRIAAGAPLAARMNKKLARRLSVAAAPMDDKELLDTFALLESEDYREGVDSFLAKRRPVFRGK